MTNRIYYQYDATMGVNHSNLHDAVVIFYKKFQMKPNVIRLSLEETHKFMMNSYGQPVIYLEKGKQYATYINTPCGPVMLDLIEEAIDDTVHIHNGAYSPNATNFAFIIVENDLVDKAFEKVILDES
jgi:hypothetical protein